MRAYARVFIVLGGAVARSYFRDIVNHHVRVGGISISANAPNCIEKTTEALALLRETSAYAYRVVTEWIERIGFADDTIFRVHFCDGTLLLKSDRQLPTSVLAAFIYRLALEVMLVKKFKMPETVLTWNPRILIGLRRELKLMHQLQCPKHYIAEQQQTIAIAERNQSRRQ